ncbi:hypothetical protein HPB52_001268 [Rhipicephalus sanguineus]|uniref:Uncharacterized protein n=1 Tax=Rhipicephalus sanguineus TaxID=34632 RepID=A0A9D4QFA8_RHISA|nr:hypothetical protein HPB52_001268 [Rhipicephalus sanguineus]
MSTGAAPICASKRKFVVRAKPSSGLKNSSPVELPSRREVNLPELFAHPEMHTRSDDPAGTTEEASSKLKSNDEIQAIPERTAPSHKFEAELASHSFSTVEESEREDSTRPFEYATILNSEDDATVVEKSHWRALRQSEVADIEKKLRRILQVHGPSDQDELLKALNPSQSQDVLRLYGTLTAFIEQLPGFVLVHEDLYTFVYYEEPDDEEYDRGGSSDLQDEADAGACSTASNNGGLQLTASDDCELQRPRSSSSSSSCYESAVEEQPEGEEKHGLKDASCQVSSSPCCHSRGIQAVQETSDAEAQTNELDTSRSLELASTPQGAGAGVTQMKEGQENLRQNQVGEVQQLKTEQLLKSPQAATPQYVVKLKNRTATKEQKAVDKNRAGDEVSPPQPRLPLRQRNLAPRLRPGNKLLMPQVEPRSWPLEEFDEQFSRPAKPRFHELPDSEKAATASTDVEYTRSSQRETAKGKTHKQISKIVRIVKKQQPELADHEIRVEIDRLRRSVGGLSGMTFSAIVEVLLGKAKAEPEEKH